MGRYNNYSTLVIRKRFLLLVLLTIPFMEVPCIKRVSWLHIIFQSWQVLSLVLIILTAILSKHIFSRIVYFILCIQGYVLVNTFIQHGDVKTFTKESIYILAIAMLYDVFISEESFIESQVFCFELLTYINLLTILMFPDGLYTVENVVSLRYVWKASKYWFLGFYNTFTEFYIPGLTFMFVLTYQRNQKKRAALFLMAIVSSLLLVKSGGNLLAMFIMIFVYFFFRKYTKIFNYLNYWMIQLVFLVFVFFYNIQSHFEWLLVDILHKKHSLNDRIILWKRIIGFIQQRLIFGYGYENGNLRSIKYGIGAWARYAHNSFLEIIYQGGLVYLILFALLVFAAGKKAMKDKDNNMVAIISCAFLGWSVQSMVDAYFTPFLIGMFVVLFNYGKIYDSSATYVTERNASA